MYIHPINNTKKTSLQKININFIKKKKNRNAEKRIKVMEYYYGRVTQSTEKIQKHWQNPYVLEFKSLQKLLYTNL